jgi:hypothetical protein
MNARSRDFWLFQAIFWLIAGLTLFISGATQMPVFEALVRNGFLLVAGFLTSFFLAMAIDELRWLQILRLRITAYILAYGVAVFCVVVINAISYGLRDVALSDMRFGQWFSGAMNLGLVYAFWAELFIQQIYLGESAIERGSPERLQVEHRGRQLSLNPEDIDSITAAGDYVEIACGDITYLNRQTLHSLDEAFGDDVFVRIHRSRLVNRRRVVDVRALSKGRYQLTLESGAQVTSSRGYRDVVREIFVESG